VLTSADLPGQLHAESDTTLLQQFLDAYKEMVRHHCSMRTEKFVEELGIGYRRPRRAVEENGEAAADEVGTGASREVRPPESDQVPLEEFCLGWLVRQPQVDCVLNGITRESYARTALSLLRRVSEAQPSTSTAPAPVPGTAVST
jgi:hypothetical protein